VDRVKDSLRRRGENISSVEVETVVMGHPAVLEAAVVGVASDLGEDDILLFVTVRSDSALDYPELLDFCGARMPYFSVPRYVDIVSELPKTIIGRVRRYSSRPRRRTRRLGPRKPRIHRQPVDRETNRWP